ncbi:MAG: hypothetical protein JWN69_1950 [Alphaproteobacteria bacterium]|nr:hypothetical protein [Alphaproteobacteria bacterium]
MAATPRVQHIFSTPLLVDRIDDPIFNLALEKAILARQSQDPGVKRSNVGGWHSDLQLLEWGGDPARRLFDHVIALANKNTVHRSGGDVATDWRVEGWANVSQNGAANSMHVHGGCYWSAVYYVRIDEGKGGQLVFYDPRMPTLAMHAPHLRFRNSNGEREVRVGPVPGLLIIFPSWLSHAVDPWYGEGFRISIAINLTAFRHTLPAPALMPTKRVAKAQATAPAKDE